MNDNIASFSPYQSRKGHIKKFWSPKPQDTLLLWSNKESWGMGSGRWEYNVLVCLYRNFTPIKFIDHGEFSALLLVEMTLAKNWCAKWL